jgi:hypothetical protein
MRPIAYSTIRKFIQIPASELALLWEQYRHQQSKMQTWKLTLQGASMKRVLVAVVACATLAAWGQVESNAEWELVAQSAKTDLKYFYKKSSKLLL